MVHYSVHNLVFKISTILTNWLAFLFTDTKKNSKEKYRCIVKEHKIEEGKAESVEDNAERENIFKSNRGKT